MPRKNAIMGSGVAAQAAANIEGQIATGLVATGSTQATALALTADINVLGTVAANTGGILPALGWNQGDSMEVYNNGANAASIYPPVGSAIGTLAANAAVSIPAGKGALFRCIDSVPNYVAIVSA